MSITDAFRLLNGSLRGIRNDKRQHEQNMQKLETDKVRLEYEMNDPQRQLARQKAADQTKVVIGQSGITLNPDNAEMDQTFAFNRSLPGMNSMLSADGVELNNKGVMVSKGTSNAAQMPQWKAKELKAQIGIYMAMESGKEAMVNDEIDSLTGRLSKMDEAIRDVGDLHKRGKPKLDRMNMQNRLDKLTKKRDDPETYSQMLQSDNMDHMDQLSTLYRMPTENKTLIDMLHKKIQINNSTINSLAKQTGLKGLKSFSYTRPAGGGGTKTRTAYHLPGQAPASFKDEQGQRWEMGTFKAKAGAGSGNAMSSKSKKVVANNKWGELERILAVSNNKAATEKLIQDLVAGGKAEDEKFLRGLLDKPTEEVIASLKEQMEGMKDIYPESEDSSWFTPWRKGKKKQVTKSNLKRQSGEKKDFSGLW